MKSPKNISSSITIVVDNARQVSCEVLPSVEAILDERIFAVIDPVVYTNVSFVVWLFVHYNKRHYVI